MKVRVCIESLLRWAVNRVGMPEGATQLSEKRVHAPIARIPEIFPNNNVRTLVAIARYPLESDYGISIHHLWRAYETVLANVSNGETEAVYLQYAKALGLKPGIAKYFFGSRNNSLGSQAAEAALKVAEIGHFIYGAKRLDDSPNAVRTGSDVLFGIVNNHVVSKFTKGLFAVEAGHQDCVYQPMIGLAVVESPRILNLYEDAEGDEAVLYILDTAVWLAKLGLGGITDRDLDLAIRSTVIGESGRVRAREREERSQLTEEMYDQGLHAIWHTDDPKRALKHLLVPLVISASEYMRDFTNPYVDTAPTPALREKLAESLGALYLRAKVKT